MRRGRWVGDFEGVPGDGRLQDVYLPGDRDPTELARAVRRDNRLTVAEEGAWSVARSCTWHALCQPGWRCTFKEPCRYCGFLK